MKLFVSKSSPMFDVPSSSEEAQFELLDDEKNAFFAQKHLEVGSTLTILGDIYHQVKTQDGYSLVRIVDHRVVYWSLYVLVPLKWGTAVSQEAGWTLYKSEYRGLARKLLLKYFLPKYGVLLSSHTQRESGIRMWHALVDESIESQFVYILSALGQLEQINSVDALGTRYKEIWGGF